MKTSSVVNPLLFRQLFTFHHSTSQKAHNNIPYYLMLLGSITTIAAANIMYSNALIESEKTQLRRHYENKSLDELVSELRKIPGFENFSAFELYDFTTRDNDYCGDPEKETQWHKKQEHILESHLAYSVFHMKYYRNKLEMAYKNMTIIDELAMKLCNHVRETEFFPVGRAVDLYYEIVKQNYWGEKEPALHVKKWERLLRAHPDFTTFQTECEKPDGKMRLLYILSSDLRELCYWQPTVTIEYMVRISDITASVTNARDYTDYDDIVNTHYRLCELYHEIYRFNDENEKARVEQIKEIAQKTGGTEATVAANVGLLSAVKGCLFFAVADAVSLGKMTQVSHTLSQLEKGLQRDIDNENHPEYKI